MRLTEIIKVNGKEYVNIKGTKGIYANAERKGAPASNAIVRLAAFEDAEEQGRLVILPCKVGDTVYEVGVNADACFDCDHYSAWYGMDAMCDINLDVYHPCFPDKPLCGKQFFEIRQYQVSSDYILRNIDAFGKTVFLTRNQAEEALKRAED